MGSQVRFKDEPSGIQAKGLQHAVVADAAVAGAEMVDAVCGERVHFWKNTVFPLRDPGALGVCHQCFERVREHQEDS